VPYGELAYAETAPMLFWALLASSPIVMQGRRMANPSSAARP
jgi:hypothetical protein